MEDYNGDVSSDPVPLPTTVTAPIQGRHNELALLMKDMEVRTTTMVVEDDFIAFATAQPISINCTPLQWWSRIEQRQRYPRLRRMAIDILSIPPESSEPERTFSGHAGHAHGIDCASFAPLLRWLNAWVTG